MSAYIPLFPLRTVLFPGLFFPLHVFEERYRELVRDLLARDEPREFGVVLIREGHEVGTGAARSLHATGCIAELRGIEPYVDGRYDIVTVGASRFELRDVDDSGAYLTAEVDLIDEPVGDDELSSVATVRADFTTYRSILSGGMEAGVPDDLPDDPVVLSYVIAAAMVVDMNEKQHLLEASDATTRLRREHDLLRRENALLRTIPSLPALDLIQTVMSPN